MTAGLVAKLPHPLNSMRNQEQGRGRGGKMPGGAALAIYARTRATPKRLRQADRGLIPHTPAVSTPARACRGLSANPLSIVHYA